MRAAATSRPTQPPAKPTRESATFGSRSLSINEPRRQQANTCHRDMSKMALKRAQLVVLATFFTVTIASQQLLRLETASSSSASLVAAASSPSSSSPLSSSLSSSATASSSKTSHLQLQRRQQQNNAHIVASTDQFIRQAFPHQPLSQEGLAFDSSQFKSIYEAVRAHPDLHEFANLCDSKGVREIVQPDNIALTVFAPIDRSLGDLLAKSKSRSINLIDLAKHHIAQGFVMPNDNMKYPFQFQSYAGLMSPLYLNMVSGASAHSNGIYVNNAKIIATYLIQIDQDNYQTLHIIDEPLEFAYVNRRTQLRAHQHRQLHHQHMAIGNSKLAHDGQSGAAATTGAASMAALVAPMRHQYATVKRALQLDDLLAAHSDELAEQTRTAIMEFNERFGDLHTNQPQVDLYRARSLSTSSAPAGSQHQWARLNQLEARSDQLLFDRLAAKLASSPSNDHDALRGRLYNLSESSSFNTYFLPVNSAELQQLLDAGEGGFPNLQDINLALQAHIIPDQVLFTRTMTLGQLHPTLQAKQHQHQQQVSLSLAKVVPVDQSQASRTETAATGVETGESEQNRRLLASPLLVQAKCELDPDAAGQQQQVESGGARFRLGLTQSEVLLANIPILNGVLHLIKRPLAVQPNNLLDYINDNDQQLSNFVKALGSQSGPYKQQQNHVATRQSGIGLSRRPSIELSKFRELLARNHRQLLASFSSDHTNTANSQYSNRTLLVPSDEAFSKLRYDLRALVFNDQLMIPSHWHPSYRQDLLTRLLERHIIPDQTITSDVIVQRQAVRNGAPDSVSSQNGQVLTFRLADEHQTGQSSDGAAQIEVDCGGSTPAHLVHRDLSGTDGVLHIIDQVLGEEQETVHSLLQSLVLAYAARLNDQPQPTSGSAEGSSFVGPAEELRELVEQSLAQVQSQKQQVQHQPADTNSQEQAAGGNSLQQQHDDQRTSTNPDQNQSQQKRQQQQDSSPELSAISKTIGLYLDGLSQAKRQLLASSVNISFHLAKLVSRAEGADDWNEKFQRPERSFTYFVPNDLAWFKLQQRQPELYKPLVYFLGQPQQQTGVTGAEAGAAVVDASAGQQQALVVASQQQQQQSAPASQMPRSSESSHRLLQILERHLIGNRKLDTAELNYGEPSVQTLGATLRLVDSNQNSNQMQPVDKTLTTTSGKSGSAFAALHSIISGVAGHSSSSSGSDEQQPISFTGQVSGAIERTIEFGSTQANILQAYETSNGFVYLIDNVLILPEDPDYIVQTSSTPAISSTMSSLLGGHNSVLFDLIQSLFSSTTSQMSINSIIVLIGTLTVAIVVLTLVAAVLIVRRYRQNKSLNRHQQLESGLTSASSANSGSTSTTKSL